MIALGKPSHRTGGPILGRSYLPQQKERTYRFIVGKSTGWRPIHLEIKTTRSLGGQPALKHYASIMDFGKVR